MNNKAVCLHPKDNVGVALKSLEGNETVGINGQNVTLLHHTPAKHKFALANFEKGAEVRMYGEVVGEATQPISKGEPITLANITHKASPYSLSFGSYKWEPLAPLKKTFMGYLRDDGQVGTANYWLVFPLVFCENQNIQTLQEAFEIALGYRNQNPYVDEVLASIRGEQNQNHRAGSSLPINSTQPFENIDGIRFIQHQLGCGGTRRDAQTLCRLLAGYVNHPNVAGATVLSLGCQNAEFRLLQERLTEIQEAASKPLIHCDQQELGTTDALLKYAINKTVEGLKKANQINRSPQPMSKLVVGLECGGSDGFSGISANPTLGRVSDLIISNGGAAILSEFPELCGAEQNLINRCSTKETAEKFMHLMKSYDDDAKAVGSGFDMNPSPGNIKDGLLTDAMKSLGAAKKGGLAPVSDVLDYTEYIRTTGLNLLCTPGNDVESTTGLAASGANIILFTTGLGTPTGNPVCPVVKVSSNDAVALKMPDIIDFSTGGVISGEKSVEECGDELLELVLKIASGETKSKAEINQNYDFIPWKRGVSL